MAAFAKSWRRVSAQNEDNHHRNPGDQDHGLLDTHVPQPSFQEIL
jgi:hypothetical protein